MFDESTPAETIDAAVSAAFASNGGDGNLGQFSDERYAFLFKPGSYAKRPRLTTQKTEHLVTVRVCVCVF